MNCEYIGLKGGWCIEAGALQFITVLRNLRSLIKFLNSIVIGKVGGCVDGVRVGRGESRGVVVGA